MTVTVRLTQAQVQGVLEDAKEEKGSLAVLLRGSDDGWREVARKLERSNVWDFQDVSLSQSLLRGLVVLACFPVDGTALGATEVANAVGASVSTTHRYVSTLAAVGLLEQTAEGRRYRLRGRA
jgi:IclR helix-turn-helix domain